MLRDLTRNDWLSILGLPERRIPKTLILRGTRNLKSQYEVYRAHFSNVLEIGSPNGILEDVFIGDLGGFSVAYASVYGAPMASEVVHVFGVLGTSLVVQTGCCGALAKEIGPGDLFIATEAYCGEGASQYYKPDGKMVKASLNVAESSAIEGINDVSVHFGRIYTTSALFAEGKKEIEDWFRKGFSAVDMETSATFAVAEHFGMDRVSILFVFDNPRGKEHILLEYALYLMKEADKDKRRLLGNRRMIQLAFGIVKEYNKAKSI